MTKIQFTVIILLTTFLQSSATSAAVAKPPLRADRIAGELLVGGAMAAVTGGAFYGLSYVELCFHGCSRSPEDEKGGISAAILAAMPGSALGVYLIGASGKETGSYGIALLGAIAGGLPPYIIWTRGGSTLKEREPWIAVTSVALGVVGAVVGFNLSREYDSSGGTALLNLKNGRAIWGIPAVSVAGSTTQGREVVATV